MTASDWPLKKLAVASLHLDAKNPRLDFAEEASPRDLIQRLFEHDKALDVAQSIALRGFFPNEPLLAIKEKDRFIVVEGNRRLAALKALRDPTLLEGSLERQVERLSRRLSSLDSLAKVPVIVAPSRRATDRQVAGKHVGTPVLPWQAENRAKFILEKLEEGYETEDLIDELGFTLSDIQAARQTKAIAAIARSMELPIELKQRLDKPRAKIFTTIERVFDSSIGRKYLRISPDPDHGFRGQTSGEEFLKGLKKLVVDIGEGRQSSRTLNSNDDIESYFQSWKNEELPKAKKTSFVATDLVGEKPQVLKKKANISSTAKKEITIHSTALPKTLKVRFGNERLVDIRKELIRLKRGDFPNAGAVLLRVFFELAVVNYLDRIGELAVIIQRLKSKNKLQYAIPTMSQLAPEIVKIAKQKLDPSQASQVEKALRYDKAAPFTLSDMHSFVHQNSEMPGDRDILQFWVRTEPLFRLMLEEDGGEPSDE